MHNITLHYAGFGVIQKRAMHFLISILLPHTEVDIPRSANHAPLAQNPGYTDSATDIIQLNITYESNRGADPEYIDNK